MDVGRRPRKRNKDKDKKLATWNVQSLYRPGALARMNVKKIFERKLER